MTQALENDFYNFLIAWREWAQADKPSTRFAHGGLCLNYINGWKNPHCRRESKRMFLKNMLLAEFSDHYNFPFNWTFKTYYEETDAKLSHKNPLRLAWVDRKIAEYGKKYHE